MDLEEKIIELKQSIKIVQKNPLFKSNVTTLILLEEAVRKLIEFERICYGSKQQPGKKIVQSREMIETAILEFEEDFYEGLEMYALSN